MIFPSETRVYHNKQQRGKGLQTENEKEQIKKIQKLSNYIKANINKTTGCKTGTVYLESTKVHFGKMQFIQIFTTCLRKQKFKVFGFVRLTYKHIFVEKAKANLEHLKPCDAIMPVNPRYTAEEWQEIYAAQKLSPEYSPDFKQGTEPQQGNNLCHIFEKS